MTRAHRLLLALIALATLVSSACTTIIRPTKPSDPIAAPSHLAGLRFDGEQVRLREPGMPVSSSRSWQREVSNYTAKTLNTLVDADPTAPATQTVVVFDLAGRSAIQIGTWKEMTIELVSTLPGGQVVRSEPVTANIDSWFEHFALQGATVGGSCLDVGVAVGMLVLFISPPGFLQPDQQLGLCGCVIGMLVGGLVLHASQSIGGYFVAASEEARWSNMYLHALEQHAEDVREAWRSGPPPVRRAPPPRAGPAASDEEPDPPLPRPRPAAPPPPVPLDPSDAADPAAPVDPADPADGPTYF